jgi:pimeloyl-ACP methyl ester carboxylesterase
MDHDGAVSSGNRDPLPDCRLVMAHGAGSEGEFLAEAFPADVLGVAEARFLDDRTGRIGAVMSAMAAAATPDRPTIVAGVSLGAHSAARLLARADRPSHVVAGLLVMPAWTGPPQRVAGLTSAAAAALAVLGTTGVLAELDPADWVTPLLRRAWSKRSPDELVAELRTAAEQPGPTDDELRSISVPVVVVALGDDPLHPVSVAQRWAQLIPHAQLAQVDRAAPGTDPAALGRAAAQAMVGWDLAQE